jgi:hypothetical protein
MAVPTSSAEAFGSLGGMTLTLRPMGSGNLLEGRRTMSKNTPTYVRQKGTDRLTRRQLALVLRALIEINEAELFDPYEKRDFRKARAKLADAFRRSLLGDADTDRRIRQASKNFGWTLPEIPSVWSSTEVPNARPQD